MLPLWRRYRNRYSQYLPLDSFSSQTASLRDRFSHALASLTLPSTWRQDMGRFAATTAVGAGGGASGLSASDFDAEELGAVHAGAGGFGGGFGSETVRLSRE